jgi:hypothetical protein
VSHLAAEQEEIGTATAGQRRHIVGWNNNSESQITLQYVHRAPIANVAVAECAIIFHIQSSKDQARVMWKQTCAQPNFDFQVANAVRRLGRNGAQCYCESLHTYLHCPYIESDVNSIIWHNAALCKGRVVRQFLPSNMEMQHMQPRLAAYYAQKFRFDCADSIRRVRKDRVSEVSWPSLRSYMHAWRRANDDQIGSDSPAADAL